MSLSRKKQQQKTGPGYTPQQRLFRFITINT